MRHCGVGYRGVGDMERALGHGGDGKFLSDGYFPAFPGLFWNAEYLMVLFQVAAELMKRKKKSSPTVPRVVALMALEAVVPTQTQHPRAPM